jgi:hypothetical protein
MRLGPSASYKIAPVICEAKIFPTTPDETPSPRAQTQITQRPKIRQSAGPGEGAAQKRHSATTGVGAVELWEDLRVRRRYKQLRSGMENLIDVQVMKLGIQLTALVLLTSTTSFGSGSWRGFLVDSKCYESEEQNVSPWYTLGSAGRDKDLELKLCVPTEKTKSFGVVQRDWKMISFDADGNAKAIEFIRKAVKQAAYLVEITGEMEKEKLKVNAIASDASFSPGQKAKTK